MSVSTSTAALFDPMAQNRALVLCVLASLALHVLVLLLVPGYRPSASSASPTRILTAKFAPRVEVPEALPAVPQAKARAEPVAPPPAPKPEAQRKAEPPRPVLAAPQSTLAGATAATAPRAPEVPAAPATPPAVTASAAPSAGQPAVAGGRASEARAPAGATSETSARSGSEADTGSLDRYRLALIGAARRYKRYPAQAMERGWQGRVEIRLIIGSNGMIQSTSVKASSGHELLDNQALDMVKKAKPLTQIPAALRGHEFTVDIPVIFDLQSG